MPNSVYNITFENQEGNVWGMELQASSKFDAVKKAMNKLKEEYSDMDFLPIEVSKGKIETITLVPEEA